MRTRRRAGPAGGSAQSAPDRGERPGNAARFRRSPYVVAAAGAVALAGYPLAAPDATYYQTVLVLAFLLAIQAISWNIISGFAGYVSLGHSVFLGLGAYTAAIGSTRWEVNPLWLAPLGGAVAVVAAVVVGAVVLRTKGHAFVIITIALLLALQICATNFTSLTGGSDGITLPMPAWSSDIQNIPFYYLLFALLLVTFAFSAWIRRSKLGMGLVAIREDEGKASSIGINTTLYKVIAYAASAVFIGVAGAVYAYFLTFLSPIGAFNILTSVTIVLAVLLGGRGTLWGPVVGAFTVQLVSEWATVQGSESVFGLQSQSRLLLFGVALALVVLFLPDGMLPTLRRRFARRQEVAFTDQSATLDRRPVTVIDRAPDLSAVNRRQPADPGRPLLEVRGAVKRFGGLRAVGGVDLAVTEGTITALIGPNGSGKTTLFNLITGTMPADSGEIWLDGARVDRLPPWGRSARGIGRTFQVTRLFTSMTVLENVVAPMRGFGWRTLTLDAVSGPEADRARELLSFVGLGRLAGLRAGALSYGQAKLVELAQVLMLQPKMILLDEPAGGINPSLVNRLVEIIRELREQGVTFLVVEHNIPLVLDLCDPVAVLCRGEIIASGAPERIRADQAVLDAYLGEAPPLAEAPGGSG